MSQVDRTASFIVGARQDALRALCLQCHVRRLDLFGSAMTGRFNAARSDLDMLVTFEDLPPGPYADAYFALKQGLEELFQREVDLVTTAGLENRYFRREVEANRQIVFSAT
jgi:hypothetical protein